MRTKATIALATGLLFLAASAIATEKAVNLYKTHKLSTNTVIVTCADGSKPIVSEGVTSSIMVIVSCETK